MTLSAIPKPMFCASHTIKGTANIRVRNGVPTDYTISLADVRLWTDPVYGTGTVASDSICLLGRLASLMNALAPDPGVYTKDYGQIGDIFFPVISVAGSTLGIRGADAITNDGGHQIMQRFGLLPYLNYGAGGNALAGGYLGGVWISPEAESGDMEENEDGFGSVIRTRGGLAYTWNIGTALPRRLVTLELLAAGKVVNRTGSEAGINTAPDTSLKRALWTWLQRGELVRYYQDKDAVKTYLTAACAISDNSITVASTTGLPASGNVWLDGERMEIWAITSGTTMDVGRIAPVAHVKYAPLSQAFMATYALDTDGGNVNRKMFKPTLRDTDAGLAGDNYDVAMPLVRSRS